MLPLQRLKRWLNAVGLLALLLVSGVLISRCGHDLPQAQNVSTVHPKRIREEPHAIPSRPVVSKGVSGDEVVWESRGSKESQRVRSTLKMEATPLGRETASEATFKVEIGVVESADIWISDKKAWVEMTDEEFHQWRNGSRDHHSATATISKIFDPQTGSVSIKRQDTVGDGKEKPARDYMETEAGINITLDWQDDTLNVCWRGHGAETQLEKVVLPFSKRFQTAKTSEQAAPSDGDKPSN